MDAFISDIKINHFSFVKDINGKFIDADDNFAWAFGADSPHQLIGKDDSHAPWRDSADYFSKCDKKIMKQHGMFEISETIVIDGIEQPIVTTKLPLYDTQRRPIGVRGFFHIYDRTIKNENPFYDPQKKRLHLGKEFDSVHLTTKETEVYRIILTENLPSDLIAERLGVAKSVIDDRITSIKAKLFCEYKYSLPPIGIKYQHLQLITKDIFTPLI